MKAPHVKVIKCFITLVPVHTHLAQLDPVHLLRGRVHLQRRRLHSKLAEVRPRAEL